MHTLTLIVPDLFAYIRGLPEEAIPRLPAFETVLAKGIRKEYGFDACTSRLCELFGLHKSVNEDYPVAALSRLIDDTEQPQGVWMRADPVHLSTSRDSLILTDPSALSFSQHDAIILGTSLEELFNEEKLRIEIPVARRWYINLPELPAMATTPVDEAIGHDIRQYLPSGPDKAKWIRLMNETQMLLHSCELNQEREKRGEIPVNSLWFWGIGRLPDILPRIWSMVYSNNPLAQGLAMLSGTSFTETPKCATEITGNADNDGEILVDLRDIPSGADNLDLRDWQEYFRKLEQDWFILILNAIRERHLDEFRLIIGGDEISFNRQSFLKFWLRQRSLSKYA